MPNDPGRLRAAGIARIDDASFACADSDTLAVPMDGDVSSTNASATALPYPSVVVDALQRKPGIHGGHVSR
jgi:hypothetical protein